MELREYQRLMRRWWKLIGGTAMLVAVLTLGVSLWLKPVYEAKVTLQVNRSSAASAQFENNSGYYATLISGILTKNYAELIQKRPILEAVIQNLKLEIDPEDLAKQIQVTAVRDTYLLDVVVEDAQPQRAADIANELTTFFSQQNQTQQGQQIAQVQKDLQVQLATIQAKITETQINIAKLESIAEEATINPDLTTPLSEQNTEKARLKLLLEQYQQDYRALHELLRIAETTPLQLMDEIKIVENAQPAKKPVRPDLPVNLFLGLLVGAMLGIGTAAITEYFDSSVKMRIEVDQLTGIPNLAEIKPLEGSKLPEKLLDLKERHSLIAKSFRILSTNVLAILGNKDPQTLLVTSCGVGEGKSTVAANLAVALAQNGKQVILVDGNLQQPTLHTLFAHPKGPGLTDLLLQMRNGQVALKDYLLPTRVANLQLLPGGEHVPNPTELLGCPRMAELVELLKTEAQIVIFDSPAVLGTADTSHLAQLCSGTLLVVLVEKTRKSGLFYTQEQLKRMMAGTQLLGTVVNYQ